MKKIILVFMALFVVCSVYSQDEFYYDDETRDAVYVAPDSKFVKKWNKVGNSNVITFYANKTFKEEYHVTNSEFGVEVAITTYIHGTWKRDRKMTLIQTYTNVTANANPKDLAKLSARKQDEIKSGLRINCANMKKKFAGKSSTFQIERVDNDHLILKQEGLWSDNEYFYCSDNLKKKLSEEETKKE